MATDDLTTIFRALADESRLGIFQLIRERCRSGSPLSENAIGQTVSEIASQFDLSLSTVSHHLKELKRAGLIECEKRGRWVHCSVDQRGLAQVEEFARASD